MTQEPGRPVTNGIELGAAARRGTNLLVCLPSGAVHAFPAKMLLDMWGKGLVNFSGGELVVTTEGGEQLERARQQA